ncbi:DDE-type integrase/transposase/recombinase [Pseudomonas aeruginosa]|uniref:DDE-type integrase/transposase/recombinase n=2 Tax=Pseudomonas aeruginosa TaxID=287 RepID=UPI0011C0D355|nr:DDE-type integrase/transposase/recombinase [Pseudomonas aeruginosa]EKX5129218.1 DDE-type integrase/transposase/recombinase [Pseudomonas aeruginosa]EMC2594285.1 DDE-type integrase/transposase/recombinase [Pseudomonas aeruginosa]KAB0695536.1 DDE-type integrase/transposase/recombinase [Pseudomonas aeruginosa]MBI8438527.1 DDE-type integrase/transposase/recombinase [Pseudomonas aeruginosa]MBI8906830.1 DDE-type integrase/transposase/recombinase [Pseudomonas aeruginosa]
MSEQGDPTIHHEVNGIYGHRRIKAELAVMGHACGRRRGGARLMRKAGLYVRSRKRWRLVSSSLHTLPIAPNQLDRQFASDRANRHWVSDMTYVRTAQGWLYLAVVLDLYARAVVGWAMHHQMQQTLVSMGLNRNLKRFGSKILYIIFLRPDANVAGLPPDCDRLNFAEW